MKCKITKLVLISSVYLLLAGSVKSQGNIFGAVERADLSVPNNGDVVFFGFVNNTDDEIRISSVTGAGYDNGNWFDDFQNYSSKAAGLPYDYYFFDLSSQEGLHLSDTIPDNSFQQEDIQLTSLSWPAPVTSLTAIRTTSNSVTISWLKITGFNYHLYRRTTGSNGSFFRIDDLSGNLSQAGIIDSQYFDNSATGIGEYDYLIITNAGANSFSPPSEIVTSSSPVSCCTDITGNINQADGVDIADLTFMINYLFITFDELPCPAAANMDGSPGGGIDIADLTIMIDHLFITFTPLAPCQ